MKLLHGLSIISLFAFTIQYGEAWDNPIYNEAKKQYDSLKSTEYTVDTTVSWKNGQFDYTCSGFLSYTIEQVDSAALDPIAIPHGASFPDSATFTTYFATLNDTSSQYYQLLTDISQLQPGDMITWKDPANDPDNGTGHSVIVWDLPWQTESTDDGKYLNCDYGTNGHWVVPIIDSTQYPHGSNDTRSEACKNQNTNECTVGNYVNDQGLGIGNIGLIGQEANSHGDKRYSVGYPIQYLWDGQSSKFYGCNTTEITMVRYIGPTGDKKLAWWAILLIVLACLICCGGIWWTGFSEIKKVFIQEGRRLEEEKDDPTSGYIQFTESGDKDPERIAAVKGNFTTV